MKASQLIRDLANEIYCIGDFELTDQDGNRLFLNVDRGKGNKPFVDVEKR